MGNDPERAAAEEIDAAIPETEWTPDDEAKAQAIGAEVGEIGREFFRSPPTYRQESDTAMTPLDWLRMRLGRCPYCTSHYRSRPVLLGHLESAHASKRQEWDR